MFDAQQWLIVHIKAFQTLPFQKVMDLLNYDNAYV